MRGLADHARQGRCDRVRIDPFAQYLVVQGSAVGVHALAPRYAVSRRVPGAAAVAQELADLRLGRSLLRQDRGRRLAQDHALEPGFFEPLRPDISRVPDRSSAAGHEEPLGSLADQHPGVVQELGAKRDDSRCRRAFGLEYREGGAMVVEVHDPDPPKLFASNGAQPHEAQNGDVSAASRKGALPFKLHDSPGKLGYLLRGEDLDVLGIKGEESPEAPRNGPYDVFEPVMGPAHANEGQVLVADGASAQSVVSEGLGEGANGVEVQVGHFGSWGEAIKDASSGPAVGGSDRGIGKAIELALVGNCADCRAHSIVRQPSGASVALKGGEEALGEMIGSHSPSVLAILPAVKPGRSSEGVALAAVSRPGAFPGQSHPVPRGLWMAEREELRSAMGERGPSAWQIGAYSATLDIFVTHCPTLGQIAPNTERAANGWAVAA